MVEHVSYKQEMNVPMTNTKTIDVRSSTNGSMTFLREFLKHPLQVGSMLPSSRFLKRRIVEAIEPEAGITIVELGPGMGGTTRAILAEMPSDGKLLTIEVNPELHTIVSDIDDPRLVAHLGSANDLRSILDSYAMDAPKVVVSGIPFSNISPEKGSRLVAEIKSVLAPDGRFVAYQVRNRVAALSEPVFGAGDAELEIRNFPPMRIYSWQKNGIES